MMYPSSCECEMASGSGAGSAEPCITAPESGQPIWSTVSLPFLLLFVPVLILLAHTCTCRAAEMECLIACKSMPLPWVLSPSCLH